LGLGLAAVKGLVELHRGQVLAHSEGSGRGAQITVLLPLTAPRDRPETLAVPAAAPARALCVLIVEDNQDAAHTLRDLLESRGHTTAVAYSGREALELAPRVRPEVILCDLGLPGMDGYELARALRREPATQESRLIVLSGYGQEDDRRRSREAGFDLHLTKPVEIEELERALAGE
jgi:CheY-like chemotaxis protein